MKIFPRRWPLAITLALSTANLHETLHQVYLQALENDHQLQPIPPVTVPKTRLKYWDDLRCYRKCAGAQCSRPWDSIGKQATNNGEIESENEAYSVTLNQPCLIWALGLGLNAAKH